jgi:hypothetical protein
MYIEIAAKDVAEAFLPRPRQGVVDAPYQERQRLAEMADLQARMGRGPV